MAVYAGPVLDSHFHLWDLSLDRHPWLRPTGSIGPRGAFDALRGHDYLLADFARDIAGQNVVAAVHVEALWDGEDDPVNETIWLESLERTGAIATRYVAGVPFEHELALERIRRQAAFSRVVAVRQTIAWTPHPDRRMVQHPDLTRRAWFRTAVRELLENDLSLELLLYPDQAENVVELARDFPSLQIIVDHIGSPVDQSDEGLTLWRDSIRTLSDIPNVSVKISSIGSYVAAPGVAAATPFIEHLYAQLGARRLMFGSDYPTTRVSGWSYADQLSAYKEILSTAPADDQRAIFLENAARIYRIDLDRPEALPR